MAVAVSSSSESHTGTTGSSNEASFSWTHTQTGTPQGVLVFVMVINSSSDNAGTITYGSTTLSRVTNGNAVDTAAEPGRTVAYFAGENLPSGNQTITVNRTNNADVMYAVGVTVTSGGNTSTAGVFVEENNQTLTEENVDDGSPGTNSVRFLGSYSGRGAFGSQANRITVGPNSTNLQQIDFGARLAGVVAETTPGQGSRPVGVTCNTSDDFAGVYLAVTEVSADPELLADVQTYILTGNETTFFVGKNLTAELGSFTLTGNDANFTLGFSPYC